MHRECRERFPRHVPWCMPGSLTGGFLWSRCVGETLPAFSAHAQPTILRICQEAYCCSSMHDTNCCEINHQNCNAVYIIYIYIVSTLGVVGVVSDWCAILIAHQIVMAKHGGSCVHFSGISTCGRTSRETVSYPQCPPLPTLCKISLPIYVIVTKKLLQPLTTTWYDSLVLSISLLKI